MFCVNCGKEMAHDAGYCDNCGVKVDNANEHFNEKKNTANFNFLRLKPEKEILKKIYTEILLLLSLLFFPYGYVQITLFGEGKKTYISTFEEPAFIIYALLIVLTLILTKKRQFLYAAGICSFTFLLSVWRAYGMFSVEADFGTTIKIYEIAALFPIFFSFSPALSLFRLNRR